MTEKTTLHHCSFAEQSEGYHSPFQFKEVFKIKKILVSQMILVEYKNLE